MTIVGLRKEEKWAKDGPIPEGQNGWNNFVRKHMFLFFKTVKEDPNLRIRYSIAASIESETTV